MEQISIPLAFPINWGWLQIGPYIHLNIDPVLFHLGPLAVRWYGLMYVVAIVMGLWLIRKYITRQGITKEQVYRMLWWCVVAGLLGGRLYFVIQQPDLVPDYLLKPQHILATWEGGMAFYGAVFLIVPVLFWRAIKERLNPLVVLDAGALFAAVAQPFARLGNLINGDIIGYPSTLPWSMVYDHPASWACRNLQAGTCHVPVQPAAGYELLLNLLLIGILLPLVRRYRRPGMLLLTYLGGYALTQFFVFFARANTVVPLFALDWGLKQAQWTSLVILLLLVPLVPWVRHWRFAEIIPAGEIPATYGMPHQSPPKRKSKIEEISDGEHSKEGAE
ncbi:MAG TPA: prolipoprotein diacylglyceryl transferase [Ktedonosporobacter sp.]|nr:prolipoprotein diacylglyceryl transferase [Ktedonosporobacter sp.]